MRVANGLLLFSARDVDHGAELWASDGTAAGTRLVLDINPGPSSSQLTLTLAYGNRMLFTADDGTHGRELWITDGTSAGTRMLKDINAGFVSAFPSFLVPFGNSVYFSAVGGLWKTDGTEAGTVKVAAVGVRNLKVASGRLFFEGSTGGDNWEPWVSDGSEAGTRMISDIVPGPQGSLTYSFLDSTPFGDGILFLADDRIHGNEIWITDGTAAGTRMVSDLIPGAVGMFSHSPATFTVLGERAYFIAHDEHGEELWVTDGTEDGTALFADLNPGSMSSYPWRLVVSNGKLYFSADGAQGSRLWISDGSVTGTRVLGEPAGLNGVYSNIVPVDGRLYFAGASSLHATEPWVSDGTDAGTFTIANLATDVAPSSIPRGITATNDLLFFYAAEGSGFVSSMWRSDGTAAGTYKLREPEQPELTAAGPYAFFKSSQSNNGSWWMSDGTVEGTKSADEFMARFGEADIESLFSFGNTLFVGGTTSNYYDASLWKTTAAPNAPAIQLGAAEPRGMIEVAGHYAFFGRTPTSTNDRGLWTTDGTPNGTYAIVPELNDDDQQMSPLVHAAGTIFFLNAQRDQNAKLWKSDGTMDGTTVVKELPSVSIPRASIVAAGRRVFFVDSNHVADDVLRTSDGTEAGTIALANIELSSTNSETYFIEAVGNGIVYATQKASGGFELWSSDGTITGTRLLASMTGYPPLLMNIDGLVYFAGVDELYGSELWTTDGTVEGTKLLVDLNPGPASSSPAELTKLGNTIYFRAYTDSTGTELWALPLTEPRLSISDARATEGDASSTMVHFSLSIAPVSTQSVTIDYATSDGTARAGEDYEATFGTVTFLAGETTKSIAVRVLGDTVTENNETFFVQLRNPGGVQLAEGEATGIVDDNDQAADLSVVASFAKNGSFMQDSANISNVGPRAATDIGVTITAVPAHGAQRYPCPIPQLAVGESVETGFSSSLFLEQTYFSAIVTARQDDPQPSNNSTSWTMNYFRSMAMNAAYLTPGGTATVTALALVPNPQTINSDPSVVAVSSALTFAGDGLVALTITALKPGTSLISIGAQPYPLLVTVVAAGTTPRWPAALTMKTDFTATHIDKPVMVTITPSGVAPVSAATATGTILLTVRGQELARKTMTDAAITFPLYLPFLGQNQLQLAYSGDANFLPQTVTTDVYAKKGHVTITGTLTRVPETADTYSLTIQVAGSPVLAPTGIISIVDGTTELTTVSLHPSADGISTAQITLSNLRNLATLTLNYSGDALYESGSQQTRVFGTRRRSARHP